MRELPKIPGVGNFLGGAESNFLLTEILDKPRSRGGRPCNGIALAVDQRLAETKGIVVRFRGKEVGCHGCIRITVGNEEEVGKLLGEMSNVLQDIYRNESNVETEDVNEQDANDVIA